MDYAKETINKISKIPLLTVEEERDLGKRIQMGDKEAEEKLIYHNLRLIIKPARHYAAYSQREFLDIFQDGVLGLMKAAKKFDVTRNTKFSTVAMSWILHCIRIEKKELEDIIRKPRYKVEFYYQIKKEEKNLTEKLGYEPSIEELAEAMQTEKEKLKETIDTFSSVASLNKIVGNHGDELSSRIDSGAESVEKIVFDKIKREELRCVFKETLTEREKYILEARFALGNQAFQTLESLANRMGITKMRVSQIEKKALEKLKKELQKTQNDSQRRKREDKISYLDILAVYQDDNLDFFISTYKEMYHALDNASKELLHKFFYTPNIQELTPKKIENAQNEINAILFQTSILEGKDKLSFSFAKTTKQEALELLKNPLFQLSEETKNTLRAYYEIKGRKLMRIEEKAKLVEILSPFYKKGISKVKK